MYHLIAKCFQAASRSKIFKYALVTNTAFGMILRSVGDVIQQRIEYKYEFKQNKQIKSNEFKLDSIRTSNAYFAYIAFI